MPKKKERKIQVRSENCHIVHVGVSYNIKDEEEQKDLDFIDQHVNTSGFIKECVRIVRKGVITESTITQLVNQLNLSAFTPTNHIPIPSSEEDIISEYEEISDDDALADVL